MGTYVDTEGRRYETDSTGHPLTRGPRPQLSHLPHETDARLNVYRMVTPGPGRKPEEQAFCRQCGVRLRGRAAMLGPVHQRQEAQRGNKSRQRKMARVTRAADKSERRTPETQKRTVKVGTTAAKKRAAAYNRGSYGGSDESGRQALQQKTARKKRRTSYAIATAKPTVLSKRTPGKAAKRG